MKKKVVILLSCLLYLSVGLAIAQDKRVSGTVFDENGDPVIGASVVAKGNATVGTVTNLDGKFTLSVPGSVTTLVVKYLGMQTQEVAVASDITVTLHSSENVLDEVMVVAYGTVKKSQFTGSATVVKADEIGKIQTSNVADALVGKVPGMQIANSSGQPGVTSPTIRIRGIGSINAGNNPLVILDGAPYEGDLNNLNSMDIESVTTLKDAASNALYGARGANGVILVTTKKGASGEARITVDAKWGANNRATQDYNYIKSPAQYYEMYFGALSSYFTNALGFSANDAYVRANQTMTLSKNDYGLGYNVYTVPTNQFLIGINGRINPNATLGNVVSYRGSEYMLKPDSWLDNLYKQSMRQEYNISISTGNDKSSFYISSGYLDQQGIIPKSDFKRFTSRLKADYQAKSWLKVGGNMAYTNYNFNYLDQTNGQGDGATNSSGNPLAIATQVAPIYPLFIRDGQGNVKIDNNGVTMYDYGDGGNAGLSRPFLGNSNAISSLLLDTNNGEGNFINASGFADITFLKNFTFSSINSVAMNETRYTNVTNPFYGQYASSNGIVNKVHDRTLAYNYQQILRYIKDLDVHHINLMLGHDYSRRHYYYLSANKMNMFDPGNYELRGAVTDGSPDSYVSDYNVEDFIARGMYDYDNKYFGSLSYVREASSRFHPDNRWGNFWAAGLAWMMTKENWFNGLSWINELKLKASYGENGNDNIGNYRYVDTYQIVNSGGHPASIPYLRGNKDITWEKQSNFNAGVEFSFFNERLNGEVDYYYNKRADQLFSFPLPPSFGWTSYYANIGDSRNAGVEVDLKGLVIRTRDFEWDLNVNFTSSRNKILSMPPERKTMHISGVDGYSSGIFYIGEGIPLYTFYMKKYAGVDETGQATYYKDVLGDDGKPTGEKTKTINFSDATYYLGGTALPNAYGGFGTTLRYKGFDLSASFVYQLGGLVYDYDYALSMMSPYPNSRGSNFHADLLNAWTPENKTSNIPRFQFGDTFTASTSDRFLTDASYLSLQNINLGYTLPARICRHLGIEKIRFYGVCDNVWLWSKRQGLDPRQSNEPYNATNNTSGNDGYTTASYYAPVRIFSGGITFTF